MLISEFHGEYLGGHVKFPDKCKILLKLGNEAIDVYPDDSSSKSWVPPEPFLTISYKTITNIQNVPSDKIDTLRVLAIGLIGGLLWRKKENVLLLTFKDDIGFDQTVVLKMLNTEGVHEAVYSKVAELKRNKKPGLR